MSLAIILLAAILVTDDAARAATFVEALALFGIGFSWGGFESLALIGDPAHTRTVKRWPEPGILVRFHAGLECSNDLIADLDQALRIIAEV